MPAGRINFIVIYEGDSQVYGCASKQIALETPPPEGMDLSAKRIYFITHQPDRHDVVAHELPREEVEGVVLKYRRHKGDSEVDG